MVRFFQQTFARLQLSFISTSSQAWHSCSRFKRMETVECCLWIANQNTLPVITHLKRAVYPRQSKSQAV